MASGPFPLSHSKARSFLRCRQQYWFGYLSGLPRPPQVMHASGIIGSGVHRALKVLCETGDEQCGADELDAYLRMPAHEVAGPGTDAAADAFALFERGCQAHDSIASERRSAEVDTHAFGLGISLRARVDRVDRLAAGHWQVIDWKTGRLEEDDVTDEQLDIGHVGVRISKQLAREDTVTAIAWNLRSGHRRVRELVRKDAVATMRRYAALAAEMQATDAFEASPGPHCGFCDWRPQCPAANAAEVTWFDDGEDDDED